MFTQDAAAQTAGKRVHRPVLLHPRATMAIVRDAHLCRSSQQPGKPKPPGNPQKHPDHAVPPPIEDPPEPIPTPSERDDPPPMNV